MFKSPARMISYLPNILLILAETSSKNSSLSVFEGWKAKRMHHFFLTMVSSRHFSTFRFKVFHLLRDKTSGKNHFPSSLGVLISPERWKLIPFYFELMIGEARIRFCFVNTSTSIFVFFRISLKVMIFSCKEFMLR